MIKILVKNKYTDTFIRLALNVIKYYNMFDIIVDRNTQENTKVPNIHRPINVSIDTNHVYRYPYIFLNDNEPINVVIDLAEYHTRFIPKNFYESNSDRIEVLFKFMFES